MKKKRLRFSVFPRHVIEAPLKAINGMGEDIPMPPNVIISITDPDSREAAIPPSKETKDILRLQFWDIVDYSRMATEEEKKKYERIFDDFDALAIVKFIQQHIDDVEMIICHCEAGISRSAGVAAALARLCNGDDQDFFARYHPNKLVHRKIQLAWRRLEAAPSHPDSCPDCGKEACQIPYDADENPDSSLYACPHCYDIYDAKDKPCWPKPKEKDESPSPDDRLPPQA